MKKLILSVITAVCFMFVTNSSNAQQRTTTLDQTRSGTSTMQDSTKLNQPQTKRDKKGQMKRDTTHKNDWNKNGTDRRDSMNRGQRTTPTTGSGITPNGTNNGTNGSGTTGTTGTGTNRGSSTGTTTGSGSSTNGTNGTGTSDRR